MYKISMLKIIKIRNFVCKSCSILLDQELIRLIFTYETLIWNITVKNNETFITNIKNIWIHIIPHNAAIEVSCLFDKRRN